MNIDRLKRRLNRLTKQKDELEQKHQGNEQKYTYYGGFDLGYLKGKIDEIENIIDELEEDSPKPKLHRSRRGVPRNTGQCDHVRNINSGICIRCGEPQF